MKQTAEEALRTENAQLKERLIEMEDLIFAIRQGNIDALVFYAKEGEKVFTLKSADKGYRLLVESIHEGAAILSGDGAVYYANPRLSEMIRSDNRKITGSEMIEYVHAKDRKIFKRLFAEAGQGSACSGEIRLVVKGGTDLPVYISLSPLPLEEFHGIAIIFTDLTEQKRYIDRLKTSNKELQDFAFIASHDLYEPLRKVATFGQMLRQGYADSLDEPGKDYLTRMLNATTRMQTLLKSLLDYSRVTTKAEPFNNVDLSEVIREVLSDLEIQIERTRGRVDAESLPEITADSSQMRQLFQNLIGNALKFHKPDRTPEVRIRSGVIDGNSIRIDVSDNGIGFDQAFVDKIFHPFFRLHGRMDFEGTGIGLAICKKIVDRHGGALTVKSVPDQGSVFSIHLPVNPKKNFAENQSVDPVPPSGDPM